MKKQNFVFISILIISLSLLLGARVWYDGKCAKFQDENMELQTLYLLDTRRGSRYEKRTGSDRKFLRDKNRKGRLTTLEDLKMFPNLSRLNSASEAGYMTDEEAAEFQKYRGKSPEMLSKTLPKLSKLKELDLTRFDYFENLDFLSRCTQIEYLDITDNTIQDIQGLQNMSSLRFLNLGYNPFTDISPLQELPHLEVINLYQVPVDNLEVLLQIPWLEDCNLRTR